MGSNQREWFWEVMEYLLETKGKNIRPEWLLRVQGVMRNPLHAKSIEVASLVEILHLASLLHDDVIDRAPQRRGRESVNSCWGNSVAILVGDYLLSRLFHHLVLLKGIVRLQHFARAARHLSEGSLLELNARFQPRLSIQEYYRIVARKTASLFALSSALACDLSSASFTQFRTAMQMGWHFGLIFQILDDILDFQMDGSTGKPPFQDLRRGFFTLPLLLALDGSSPSSLFPSAPVQPEEWEEFIARSEEKILHFVYERQGLERARTEAEYHLSLLLEYLDNFPETEEKEDFAQWVQLSIHRQK